MSIYFQFKSSTVRESIDIDGHFISVGELRAKILETKLSSNRNRKSDFNIVVSNYDTMEDYTDDSTLIPRNSTVWVRRVPAKLDSLQPIIASPARVLVEEPKAVEIDPEEQEWNELLDVINGKSEPTLPGNAAAPETGEESRIKALVETPALGWQGYGGGFGWNAPPPGYVCHRCKVAGHFIQHCPTNGDPAYDINKFVRPPTAVLRPNEAAFGRGMEGVSSSSRSADQLPPELHCRLCKQVMKDAVLTSRCCFDSFCDRCIRGHIISKNSCVCGATNVLADHLIPNLTLRNTISRILESKSSSSSGEGASQHDATLQQVLPPPEKQESVTLPKAAESQESAPLVNEAVEQKPEAPKKMKTALPVPMPMPVAANNNYMMPPMGFNPYWGGFMPPYAGYGYGYGYNYGYGPMMNQPVRGEQGKKPSTVVLNAESREATAKRKRDEDQDHGREVRSRLSDKPSSQLPNKKVEHHHSDHGRRRDPRDERICGDVSSSKIRLSDRPSSQLPNKKVEHRHSDHSRRRDPRDDRYQRDERHHHSRASSSHHRSESTKTVTAAESKRAIPTKEAALKRKLSSSSSNGRYEHKAASVGSRKSTISSHAPVSLAYDEGSDDDDDRHFKRRSSWSKSSPPAPRLMRVV